MQFLSTKHMSITVSVATTADDYPCTKKSFIKLKAASGYITTDLAHRKGWGSITCPWRVEAQPGQSISITLINFGAELNGHTCKPIG